MYVDMISLLYTSHSSTPSIQSAWRSRTDTRAAHDQVSQEPTVLQLQNELAEANRQISELKDSFTQLQIVHEEYASSLDKATQMAREFEDKEQKYLQSVHEHYSAQLLQARGETMEAQLTHQAWQARLKTLDETVKKAYKAREEEGQPYRQRIAALKEENRILRSKVGWDPPADSEDEEWDEEASRGRLSRASQDVLGERPALHGQVFGATGIVG